MASVFGKTEGKIRRWWIALWLPAVLAGDPAERLNISEPIQFRYQETRLLALLAEPWQGSGFMLADPDGTLVKLQLAPQRIIMIAAPDELLYYDPGIGERRRLPLPAEVPQVEGIVLLQHLLRGELEPIRRRYRLDYRETADGWRLDLSPKKPESAPFRTVVLRGDAEGRRRVLEITEPDGDRSMTELILDDQGDRLRFTIARLREEAVGK
ncbi:LolA family protein [Methylohalobius crimeensis]|uniref:LolA family protein n=1 Tax=Methylohalobius crimeensis TaxID=244365 RepID=UPI0012680896|nr:hypothetical protein [Methylohalobius crimeensis]